MQEKMKLCDLENLFEEIQDIINYIEISEYKNRRFGLYLGNGDRLNFYVPNENIAHLLGINTNYLISTGRFNSTNSFMLLKELIENPYRINTMFKQNVIDYNVLFSDFIKRKVENFKQNIKLDIDKIEFICKYDSNRAYLNNKLSKKFNYCIVKKYPDGKIGILCIVKKNNSYVPMSNLIYNNLEEASETLEEIIKYQEITTLNGINIYNIESDYDATIYTNLNTKINKIKNMKEYKNMFDCSIDLSGDYQYTVGILKRSKDNQSENNELVNDIINSIVNGKLIDNKITDDENLVKIINSFNNHLSNSLIDGDVSKTYTKVLDELNYFKSECEKLKKEKDDLSNKNNSLNEVISSLETQTTEYKNRENKILEILKYKPSI